MRKTKIICTIGPACESEETLTKMCLAGMNVARLNFSHGTHEQHLQKIQTIKKVREKLNLPIAIMLDTKGPEYRIRNFKNGSIVLEENDIFTFTTDDVEGDKTRVSVNYKYLPNDLEVGDRITVNNGLVIFDVAKIEGHNVVCKVVVGGELSNQKSMNFPNKLINNVYLSDTDKDDLLFGIKHGVDFVAASFVSRKQDLDDLRKFLNDNGGADIDVIAKIENRSGVNNIDEICQVADGVMVARGDLGVEIPFVEVPAVQKFLIKKCRMLGKRVITATEMLESMIRNPRPTRAEINDVANAVYDGSSAIMLSGETASGKYPIETVKTMSEIAEFTEQNIDYNRWFNTTEFRITSVTDALSHATCSMAIDVDAKCIVVSTLSGRTARMVSRFRPPIDIVGMTLDDKVLRKLNLSWGVTPLKTEKMNTTDEMYYRALEQAAQFLHLNKGDSVVLTGGEVDGKIGNTNTIKVMKV